MRFVRKSAGEIVKQEGAEGHFTGYGSTFGNVDSDADIIAPGAFSKSLADLRSNGQMPAMLFGHDRNRPIGDYLEAKEDNHGLWLEGQLWVDGAHPVADSLTARRMMKGPGGAGLSIGFWVRKDEYDATREIRTITDAKLVEVSVVTFPANELARTSGVKGDNEFQSILREIFSMIDTPRDFERFLRDAGCTREQAKAIAAVGWKKADPRDGAAGGKGDPRDAELDALERLARALRAA